MEQAEKSPLPTEPGIYWAKTGSYRWFNALACVDGEAPFLTVASVWFYPDDKMSTSVSPSKIAVWGPRVEVPEQNP